jgi:hypothetical protein
VTHESKEMHPEIGSAEPQTNDITQSSARSQKMNANADACIPVSPELVFYLISEFSLAHVTFSGLR